jgi:DNA-binding MarR family transcriptional regulator
MTVAGTPEFVIIQNGEGESSAGMITEAALSEVGVTSQQYQALLVIKVAPAGQIIVRDLAEQMLLQHNGAVQLVDRLEAAGLAVRIPSQEDKRSVLIRLTEVGEELLEQLARIHPTACSAMKNC